MHKIAICDDNPIFRDYLKNLIKTNPHCPTDSIIYEYSSGEQMIMEMDGLFDLAIIDIQLPKRNGFSIAEELFKLNPTGILVYCSGVIMPTVEAFKVQPYRYLLKQETKTQMLQDIDCILKEMKRRHHQYFSTMTADNEEIRLKLNDILYFSSQHRGCDIRYYNIANGERRLQTISSKNRIHDINLRINKSTFFLIQRSFIINFDYIVMVDTNSVTMEDGMIINISRVKTQAFHNSFSDYIGVKYRRNH